MSGHEFVIMWNEEDILDLIDLTAHEQEELINLLKENNIKPEMRGNPVRSMVVKSVLASDHREIWQFQSTLRATEICDEWEENSESVMNEIRNVGVLIYDSERKKIKC